MFEISFRAEFCIETKLTWKFSALDVNKILGTQVFSIGTDGKRKHKSFFYAKSKLGLQTAAMPAWKLDLHRYCFRSISDVVRAAKYRELHLSQSNAK